MKFEHSIYGDIHLPELQSDLITRAIVEYGEWAYHETQLLSAMISADDVVVDVGAYLGTFSMGLLTENNSLAAKQFHLVDSNPQVSACLTQNCQRYGFHQIDRILGNGQNSLQRHETDGNYGATRYLEQEAGNSGIEPLPLWQLRSEIIGPYSVLKLDAEGMEKTVLQSDQKWILENNPLIYAECNEAVESISLYKYLNWLGYAVYFFSFPAFRKKNFRRSDTDIFHGGHEAAFLCLPDGLKKPAKPVGTVLKKIDSAEHLRALLWEKPKYVRAELQHKNRQQLTSLLTRLLDGEQFSTFLSEDDCATEASEP